MDYNSDYDYDYDNVMNLNYKINYNTDAVIRRDYKVMLYLYFIKIII